MTMMENSRVCGRKRYCCYYCNTYFYQVDSWQRHNRKHTCVEIECDDCGEMCSDHFELKAHQQLCEAYHMYSEDVFTQAPSANHPNGQSSSGDRQNESSSVHETPDSTSKQESLPDNDEKTESSMMTQQNELSEKSEEVIRKSDYAELNVLPDNDKDVAKSSELDYLIGEDQGHVSPDEEDPDTEAMIGIDQSEVTQMKNIENESKPNAGVDSRIVIKVESVLNTVKQNYAEALNGKENVEIPSFFNRPSSLGTSINSQAISLEGSDMNKKYQPYFCKNCGARFTRKDSVTRHLKKGTCSGKSAIVCNICGKVFSEMFELQGHFKLEHKSVVFTPTIVHRSILPRIENHEQPSYSHYPAHYVVNDQHMNHVARPFLPPEQSYRPMPPGLQTMFYGNQANFGHRPAHPPGSGLYHDQIIIQPRAMELRYSPTGQMGKDVAFVSNSGKLLISHNDEMNRKREFADSHAQEMYHEDLDLIRKNRKLEVEFPSKQFQYRAEKFLSSNESINLSEYTNSAMSSKQYYENRFSKHETSAGKDDPMSSKQYCENIFSKREASAGKDDPMNSKQYCENRFSKHEASAGKDDPMSSKQYYENRFSKREASSGKDEPPRGHQCKVCGLEFPRFEYLLTHLRKHKEKNEVVEPMDDHREQNMGKHDHSKDFHTSATEITVSLNDSNSSSSDDNDLNQPKLNFVMSQMKEKQVHPSPHQPVPIIIQQPQSRYSLLPTSTEMYAHSREQVYPPQSSQLITTSNAATDGTVEAITPGVDGKFRPFICENCGQRFTRKDSLVRHAKKQTCYEELVDLKCKHCDKTFRYHKCLVQHQELVHGIPREEQKIGNSDDERSESDKSERNELDVGERGLSNENKFQEENYVAHGFGTDKTVAKSDFPLSQYHPFIHENPYSTQAAPPNHHLGPSSKLIPPTPEEKKPQENNNQPSNQESQYIGYCMLPRPFQCEYCGDRFAHRHSLKRHVRRHLGIGIPCHDCGKLYRDQSEWRRHQRSIHNRHFEKYEVPSRMSFRDGVEQGLIGIIPKTEYDGQDESDSEKSDEEMSMAKARGKFTGLRKKTEENPLTKNNSFTSRLSEFGFHKAKAEEENEKSSEKSVNVKEEKSKPFDFKIHSLGDKDSRKSVLDLYLCSPNSDEGGEQEKNNHI